jgi:hypothetical protein
MLQQHYVKQVKRVRHTVNTLEKLVKFIAQRLCKTTKSANVKNSFVSLNLNRIISSLFLFIKIAKSVITAAISDHRMSGNALPHHLA